MVTTSPAYEVSTAVSRQAIERLVMRRALQCSLDIPAPLNLSDEFRSRSLEVQTRSYRRLAAVAAHARAEARANAHAPRVQAAALAAAAEDEQGEHEEGDGAADNVRQVLANETGEGWRA